MAANKVMQRWDRSGRTPQPFSPQAVQALVDACDRAEVRYWEEAGNCGDAAALALRLWGEHRASAELPAWQVLGLEVVDESVHRERGGTRQVMTVGGWRPF